jgi:drug/metabolite transporter (DMT)-like permease
MTAVVLALAAAALWGTGDFFGGLATRRLSVLTVLFWSQLVGLLGLVVWIVVSSAERPGEGLLYAAGAGIAGAIGLGCLYRGLAIGAMGIVAPISATSPIVPLAVSVIRGDSPTALQWSGIALALCGVVLVSREPPSEDEGAGGRVAVGVGLALVAALGFGLFVVGLGEAAQESAPWATATARLSSVTALVLALAWTRTVPRVSRRLLPLVLAVGAFDTGANALTILLARAVLHERLGPTRTAGGLVALGGAALIAAG